jgi:hypothetical protein
MINNEQETNVYKAIKKITHTCNNNDDVNKFLMGIVSCIVDFNNRIAVLEEKLKDEN